MSYKLGLTGSIGMGKSTTAAMFRDAGLPVWDADAAVHRLYAVGGAAVAPLAELYPTAIVDGQVDRSVLKQLIDQDRSVLTSLEQIVHPLVAADRAAFVDEQTADIIVFDIPLLFETGADAWLDGVAVVSAPLSVQTERVMSRGTMTAEQLETIRGRQMPDAEKRARADFVIDTLTMDGARATVQQVIEQIRKGLADA